MIKSLDVLARFSTIGKGSWVFMFRNSYRLIHVLLMKAPGLQNLYSGLSLLLLLL